MTYNSFDSGSDYLSKNTFNNDFLGKNTYDGYSLGNQLSDPFSNNNYGLGGGFKPSTYDPINTFNNDLFGKNNFGGGTLNNNLFDPFPNNNYGLGGGFKPNTYDPFSYNSPYSIGGGGGGLFGGFKSSKMPSFKSKDIETKLILSSTEDVMEPKNGSHSEQGASTVGQSLEGETPWINHLPANDYMNEYAIHNNHYVYE